MAEFVFSEWRARLQPASFRGVGFLVEADAITGGRRGVPHEYPKKNVGKWEDMGRRLMRHAVQGYLIGPNYLDDRDALINVLNDDGPGMLVHPLLGQQLVGCDRFDCRESRERGGFCTFDMAFTEAGDQSSMGSSGSDTQGLVNSAATSSDTAAVGTFNSVAGAGTPL